LLDAAFGFFEIPIAWERLLPILPGLALPPKDDPCGQSHLRFDLRDGFFACLCQLERFQFEFLGICSPLVAHVRLPETSVLWLIQVSVLSGEAHFANITTPIAKPSGDASRGQAGGKLSRQPLGVLLRKLFHIDKFRSFKRNFTIKDWPW